MDAAPADGQRSPLRDASFREILERTREGDPEAREELFSRLARDGPSSMLLLSMARRLIPRGIANREIVDPADLVQSALKSGWKSFDEFRGSTPGEFLNWIRTILRRKVCHLVRRMEGKPARLPSLDEESVPERSSELPFKALLREEIRARVRHALEDLKKNQRDVLEMRLEGLSAPQIAERLHLDSAAVRKRESRALRRLRGLLEQRGIEET